MPVTVREWDLGKIGQLSPTEKEPKHEEKNKERERRVRKEKAHHSRSPSPHDVPGNTSCNPHMLQHVLSKQLPLRALLRSLICIVWTSYSRQSISCVNENQYCCDIKWINWEMHAVIQTQTLSSECWNVWSMVWLIFMGSVFDSSFWT